MLGANATTRTPREPTTRPMTIHGRRMPSFDEVRSLIFSKNGLAKIDSREPVAATSAKLFGACLIPTSALTFSAKVTSSGARRRNCSRSHQAERPLFVAAVCVLVGAKGYADRLVLPSPQRGTKSCRWGRCFSVRGRARCWRSCGRA